MAPQQAIPPPYVVQTGLSDNVAKGYSIRIPKGYFSLANAGLSTDSGCRIDLRPGVVPAAAWTAPANAPSMGFRAVCNAAFKENLQEIQHDLIAHRQAGDPTSEVQVRSARLGSLTARRIVIRHKQFRGAGPFVEEFVVAWRRDPAISVRTHEDWLLSHMIYEGYLFTSAERYQQDRKLFQQFLGSWHPRRFD